MPEDDAVSTDETTAGTELDARYAAASCLYYQAATLAVVLLLLATSVHF